MTSLTVTGGLIYFVLPAGSGHFYSLFGYNRHDIGRVHFYLAVAAVVLLALHVALHWSWVCCVVGKAVGRKPPSPRARTAWGSALLLGMAALLAGGLFWVSSMVQHTTPDGGGRGRRAHLDEVPPAPSGPTARPSGTLTESRRAIELSVDTRSGGKHEAARDRHVHECPAGAAINGRTSIRDAARMCGLSVAQLADQLRLPASTNAQERLGRLKRRHGLDIHAVRRLACR
jgi:hypothetical protein